MIGESTDDHPTSTMDPAPLANEAEARWSGAFTLEPHVFAAHVAARISPDAQGAAMAQRHAADLYLACGCTRGIPGAVRIFEAMLRTEISSALHHMHLQPAAIDDVFQMTLERVLVGGPGRAPRIAEYAGHGTLRGWTRVVATRIALDSLRERKPEVSLENALVDLSAIQTGNPELSSRQDRFGILLKSAFDRAMESLTAADRILLRQRFVDGLSTPQIARLYRKHRITMQRRLTAILNAVRTRTQAFLKRDVGCGHASAVSIVNRVFSRADLSILRYLVPHE